VTCLHGTPELADEDAVGMVTVPFGLAGTPEEPEPEPEPEPSEAQAVSNAAPPRLASATFHPAGLLALRTMFVLFAC